jgi:glucosamine--fructose-6-phosphate aminotransferase (isomerizing)
MAKGRLMADEMAEQPDVLARLVERAAEVRATGAEVVPVDLAACAIVARGSSDHAALLGQYLLDVATGRPVALASPSLQTLYRGAPVDYRGVLVVGVSQSGATSEIVEVVVALRAAGARTIAITNDPASLKGASVGSEV